MYHKCSISTIGVEKENLHSCVVVCVYDLIMIFFSIPLFHILILRIFPFTCAVKLESCSACILDNVLLYVHNYYLMYILVRLDAK